MRLAIIEPRVGRRTSTAEGGCSFFACLPLVRRTALRGTWWEHADSVHLLLSLPGAVRRQRVLGDNGKRASGVQVPLWQRRGLGPLSV